MDNFHFLRPGWLLTMPMLLVLLMLVWRVLRYQGSWRTQCDPHLLPHLLINENANYFPWGFIILSIAAILGVLALGGPTWSHWPQPVYQHSNARIIVLDVSDSMNAQDISPSRLMRAKYKVLDLLRHIDEGQTGMLVFSKEPFIVSPLTPDSHTVAQMVPVLGSTIVPVQGHDIAAALQKAGELLAQAGAIRGSIILITDSTPAQSALTMASKLNDKNYHTFVLGIGTAKGAPIPLASGGFEQTQKGAILFSKLDSDALQRLAKAGGGQYIPFQENNTDTEQLLRLISGNRLDTKLKQTRQQQILWKDEGHWFIWGAILLGLFAFRRGWWELLCT